MMQIIHNGKFIDAGSAVVTSESRGLRFGEGCFETMRIVNGKIVLKELHFERLFSSLGSMKFNLRKSFTASKIEQEILSLIKRNDHQANCKVRLNVVSGNGGLYDIDNDNVEYLIESWALEKSGYEINENGLAVDVYKDARKSCDQFSHIKSNNFLPYVMAAKWVKQQQLDDAILLNSFDRIADATIANVFIVKDGIIKTPGLSEGCIAGVMRKHLISCCHKEGIPVEETKITAEDLMNASEVFLTNVIRGIKWVKTIGKNNYSFQIAQLLHEKVVKPLSS